MSSITITQTTKTVTGFDAELVINSTRFPVHISDPFGENPQQEKSLEWYFETWITFPFTDTVRAETAKKSVREYGEKLFEQVFGDRKAYSAYQGVSAQLNQLKIEIIGGPEFRALHWESLWEPEQPNPLAVNCKMSRRRLTGDLSPVQVQESPVLNWERNKFVLFVV